MENVVADGCLGVSDALVLLLPAEDSGHKVQKAIKMPAEGQAENRSSVSLPAFSGLSVWECD